MWGLPVLPNYFKIIYLCLDLILGKALTTKWHAAYVSNYSSIYMFKRWNISSTLCDWKKSTITKVTTTSRILTQIPAWQRLYPIWESVAYVLTKKERKTVGCLFQKCIFVRVSDSPQSISRLFFVIRKWIAHGMVFSVFCMEFS